MHIIYAYTSTSPGHETTDSALHISSNHRTKQMLSLDSQKETIAYPDKLFPSSHMTAMHLLGCWSMNACAVLCIAAAACCASSGLMITYSASQSSHSPAIIQPLPFSLSFSLSLFLSSLCLCLTSAQNTDKHARTRAHTHFAPLPRPSPLP